MKLISNIHKVRVLSASILMLSAALAGCVDNRAEIEIPAARNGSEVVFTVSVPGMQTPSTRALNAEKEKKVNEIDVVIFDSDYRICEHHRIASSDIKPGASGGNDYQFKVPGIQIDINTGFTIAVIANASAEVNTALGTVYVGMSKTDFLLALQVESATAWNTSESGYKAIPMYGELSITGYVNGGSTLPAVNLTRMLAKVDVINSVSLSSFKLTKVHVVNYNTKGLVAPKWNQTTGVPVSPPASEPNIPPGFNPATLTWASGYELTYDVNATTQSLLSEIYLFESKALSDNPSKPDDGLRLVFEGDYTSDGVTGHYFFPADFTAPQGNTGNYIPVLRNHRYLFEITEAAGRGYDSMDEAVKAFGVMSNLKTSLIVVDESDIRYMVWNGEYFLGVESQEVSVTYSAQSVNLKLATNYVKWNAAVENAVANSWLNLVTSSGSITDKTLSFTVLPFTPAEGEPQTRTANIVLTAGRLVLKVTVTQNASVGVPKDESNCYMIDPGNPKPILIPVSQLRYAMGSTPGTGVSGFLGSDWIKDKSKLKVQILWSDINAFPPSEAAVVKDVAFLPDNTNIFDSKILVTPGSGQGNALVILYEDNNGTDGYQYNTTDAIRWSWHIWKSAYYPYNADGTPNGRASSPDATSLTNDNWMDRNLGAMSSVRGDFRSCGFYYSWGRKDPWPGPRSWDRYTNGTDYPNAIQYYASNAIISSFTQTNSPNQISLSNSVNTPMIRHYNTNSGSFFDWLTPGNIDLWGGGTNTPAFLHPNGKSVYDPCPEGYRVPKNGAWGSTPAWGSLTNQGRVNYSFGGYYPCGGYMRSASQTNPPTGAAYAGSLIFLGSQSYYWSATPSGNYARGFIDYAMDTNSPGRAQSYNVRCIKE